MYSPLPTVGMIRILLSWMLFRGAAAAEGAALFRPTLASTPLPGAHAVERLAHRHVGLQHRMAVLCLQRRQRRVAGADRRLEQQARNDRQLVAHALGLVQVELRRLALAHHVEQAGTGDPARNLGNLLHRLGGLDERHVGASLQRGVGPRDRLLEAGCRARVGAGDDQEVGIASCIGGGADLRQPVLARHDRLVVEVAAALG